jgi:DsbC/DsbD-like thiol-disulfide interchange protein
MERLRLTERRLRRLVSAFLATSLVCVTAKITRAQSQVESHAKVELISEHNSFLQGHPFWVGLLFQLDKEWHIYWQNPGDSGEPPKIQWELPPGFQAGAIEWPAPVRLGSGSVVDYGYEDQVLLMAAIQTPHSPTAAGPATIAADVKYIVCREICIPGKAHLTLSIQDTNGKASPNSERHELFRHARAQLPKSAAANWKASAVSDGNHFVLSVRTGAANEKATFFPLNPGEVENSAPQVFAPSNDGFRLTLQKSDQLQKPIPTLRGLIVLGDGTAFKVVAPVARQ